MSNFIPPPAPKKIGGLGPKAQKLQALREKAANTSTDGKQTASSASTPKVKTLAGAKKVPFQRKAV